MIKVKVKEILSYLDMNAVSYEFQGNPEVEIAGFSSLTNYKQATVTWVKKSIDDLRQREIALCILQEGEKAEAKAIIKTNNSKAVFFDIIEHFFADKMKAPAIGKGTVIGERVKLGKNVIIGNNCSIDGDIDIGDNTYIADNVVIKNRVKIGSDCHIQSLTVIGEDGFGYSEDEFHKKTMIRHYGGVKIGNRVFIGSHVNIARATIDDTIIEDGVKIAPTTHIGHNNFIGEDSTVICSQLFGSVHVDRNSYITSSVIRNQCIIGENTVVGMGSVVTKNVEAGKTVIGVPAKEMQRKVKA